MVEKALNGEEVIIAKSGKPLACLLPYKPSPKRVFFCVHMHFYVGYAPRIFAIDQI
jgi:antitoxin (DNA-binding transcriptional repressor) of toxin-antitoxin stability system